AHHSGGCFKRCSNLDQWSRSDTRAGAGGAAPGAHAGNQFRPEGKEAALGGFGGVDRTATGEQEVALPAAGLAQPEKMGRAVNKASLEARRREAQVGGGAA